MSCRATLHSTGEESIPLLLVRDGILSPRQCDHEFKGLTGECPTCKAMIERADLGDGSSYAQAMLALKQRGQSVTYRRFSYGSDGGVEPWRVCYWGHGPGYWDGVQFRDCQHASTNAHAVHLEVIKGWYQKQFKPEEGFTIKVEQRLRKPGDPPRPYSPDLAIYGPKGERMVAVEYQRSRETYEKFCDRDDLRRSEDWAAVDWWFDDTQPRADKQTTTVYSQAQMHRTHLKGLGVPLFVCWVNPETLKLEADYGSCGNLPPNRQKRVERKLEKAELAECSTAQIMRQIEEGPEREIIKEYIKPLEATPGSELNFRGRFDYNAEREQRLALAVIARQTRLEEQDRRHREWVAEQQRLEAVQREQDRIAQELREAERKAAAAARQREDNRNTMISFLTNQGEDETWLRSKSDDFLDKLEDKYLARIALQEAEDEEEERRLASIKESNRLKAIAEHQREESQWKPIEFTEPRGRDATRIALNLMIDDQIRPAPGERWEIYKGRTNAGYSTHKYTYPSLIGWQVRTKDNRRLVF